MSNMNAEKYKKDLVALIQVGEKLRHSMVASISLSYREKVEKVGIKISELPNFEAHYQGWYSEAHRLFEQVLPGRAKDFESYYKPANVRKEINGGNYTISDFLKGLNITRGVQKIVGPEAAIPSFDQQISMLRGIQNRFDSSLYDIKTLVQADLFDDELEAASELNKKGFTRGAGAMAGVVLENHLQAVCYQHSETPPKTATLGKLNDFVREKTIIDLPTWRFVQHLIDLRNLCDHKMSVEPTKSQVSELIDGVRKITKTIF
jgi:hypothetical protein